MPRYDPKRIEKKWQDFWEQNRTFETPALPTAEKLYVLDMFPYPSGEGLHVGHPEGYTATDITCRYARMRGKTVLHPMGWDAFGLPAEQHAIKTGTHPRETTYKNIATFRRQLKMLGFSYDWSREVATTDPEFFRWTQWIFLQVFDTWYDPDFQWTDRAGKKHTGKGRPIAELPIPPEVNAGGRAAVRRYQDQHRLAYQTEAPVNWCPALGTVLANEEVIDGKSERGDHPVVRIPLRQWMLGITAYAERLLDDLETVNWPESIKTLQRNWIGKSTGAEVDFYIGDEQRAPTAQQSARAEAFNAWKSARATSGFPKEPGSEALRIYTTRPDTLFGATYMVLSPEHPFVDRLTTSEQKAQVEAYRRQASTKSDLDRTDLAKDKTGVFTGSYAINPVNGQPIPIWIADYVLISYGTGAIMAVPAHDERDWEFAVKFNLPIIRVVEPPAGYEPTATEKALARTVNGISETPFAGEGSGISSGEYNGMASMALKATITADLSHRGLGRRAVNYRLRDWLFSRQHFWGEPFPIWHELGSDGKPTGLMRTDTESELPVTLPEMRHFKPHGRPEPPLAEAPQDWLFKTAADGTKLARETNTMPQWAGSCWYYLRFIDPRNAKAFVDPAKEQAWMPVDLYIGGAEHAVLHLLYSRFWHKILFDRGHVSGDEPFRRLVNQGMILGEMQYRRVSQFYEIRISAREVDTDTKVASIAWSDKHDPDDWREMPFSGSRLVAYAVETENVKFIDDKPRHPDDTSVQLEAHRKADNQLEYVTFVKQEFTPVSARDAQLGAMQAEGIFTFDGKRFLARYIPTTAVEKAGADFVLAEMQNISVDARAYKMSKSRGNVINPDQVVDEYGADSLRLYEMFMGPLDAAKPWSMSGVEGVSRFLARVWRMISDEPAEEIRLNPAVKDIPPSPEQWRLLHKTIQAVTFDIEHLGFNTAISRMMEFVNAVSSVDPRPRALLDPFVLLLAPFAPHLAEEAWAVLGHMQTLAYEPWPVFDAALLVETELDIPVQVNGKMRGKVRIPAGTDQATAQAIATADPRIAENLSGKQIVKVIYVPDRLLNFVVR